MINGGMVREAFRERFGHERARLFRAPGRVNLIGEHTDYNDGFVLPMAIDRETIVAASARSDRRVRVYSLNMDETVEFDLNNPGSPQHGIWLDYVEGMAQVLKSRGIALRGADFALASDVPVGAGLSSSAALEIATGLALLSIAETEINKIELALAGQQAEHEYVGTKCGIMDQLIAVFGRQGHALLIDCRSLEMTPIPLDTTETVLVICDTRVKHELSSSAYNVRRAECERGVELLNRLLSNVQSLRDVSLSDFEAYEEQLPEPVRSRCRHVVTENVRTLRAADAVRARDYDEMGRLMRASHVSLRDDYEVSCRELDVLFEIAASIDGVYGARMTGGGFGGCTINLVQRRALGKFQEQVVHEYNKAIHTPPIIYISEPSAGAGEMMD